MSAVNMSTPSVDSVIWSSKEVQSTQASLKSIEKAISIIKAIGYILSSACVVGIWALPLDFIIYSNAIAVLTIPASLLPLPVVLLVCYLGYRHLNNKNEKEAQTYFGLLLKHMVNDQLVPAKFLQEFRRIGSMLTNLDISLGKDQVICHDHFVLTLEAVPHVEELSLDAGNLTKDAFATVIKKLPKLKKVTIRGCQALSNQDYNFLKSWKEVKNIELKGAEQINLDFLKELTKEKERIIKSAGNHNYIISEKTSHGYWSGVYLGNGGFGSGSSGGSYSCGFAWR